MTDQGTMAAATLYLEAVVGQVIDKEVHEEGESCGRTVTAVKFVVCFTLQTRQGV